MFEDFEAYLAGLDPLGLKARSRPAAYGRAYLEKTLAEIEEAGGAFLLAVAGSEIVGFVVGVLLELTDVQAMEISVRKPGRVTELYVDPRRRSQGIGGHLLHHIEDWLKDQGCDSVRIEVFAPNERARQFYYRHGYHDWVVDTTKAL